MVTRRNVIVATAVGVTLGSHALAASPSIIEVTAAAGATRGVLRFAGRRYDCAVGRSGIVHPKYEGDGGTPAGRFPMREVRYRPDRLTTAPVSGLPVFKASPSDGWCDDPEDPAYNRVIHMPYQTDAEVMWRDDHLYDVLGVIGYNDAPTFAGAGSAIFLHVAHRDGDGLGPTAGCVALQLDDVLAVLAACQPSTMIRIGTV